MNPVLAIVFVAVGLVLLWKSADLLVDGAVGLAERLGISALLIGLTIVAMGTSAPEVAAGIAAAVRGSGNIAIGNVYGSNIANLALVGGISSMLMPIVVRQRVLRVELPVMLAATFLIWPVVRDGEVTRLEGVFLLIVFVGLLAAVIIAARKGSGRVDIEEIIEIPKVVSQKVSKCVLLVVGGLVGLSVGADITVRGAVFIGQWVGLSEAVVGLTIVAVGTSLPELVTSVAAAVKGHHDLSIGNIVGSNIFNILLVTGVSGTVRPLFVSHSFSGVDFVILIGVSVIFTLMALVGRKVSRIDGGLLLALYAGYIIYLLTRGAAV